MNFVGMSIAAYEIPACNPVEFIQVAGELQRDPRFNATHRGEDWFINHIRDWQTKSKYIQKWQQNSKITLYTLANDAKQVTLEVLNLQGDVLGTFTETVYYTAAGSVIKVGNTTVAARNFIHRFRFADHVALTDGIYLFYLTIDYDFNADATVDESLHLISEPMSVAEYHIGTTTLDYYNTYNKGGILYDQTHAKFSIMLEADLVDWGVGSETIDYTGGSGDNQLLGCTTFRTAKYATTERLPPYMVDIINEAFGCNRLSWEGKPIKNEPGAKFELSRISRFPKVQAAINIVEAEAGLGKRGILMGDVPIYTTPAFPFAVFTLILISADSTAYTFPLTPVVPHDSGEHTSFIADLNSYATNVLFFAGSFSLVGSDLIWTNGVGDTIIGSTVWLYDTPLNYEVNTTTTAPITFLNGDIVVDYGDGTIEHVTGTGYFNNAAHTYSIPGIYTIQIYGYAGTVAISEPDLGSVSGKAFVGQKNLSIYGTSYLTVFDCSVMSLAAPTLEYLLVYNNILLSSVTNLTTLDLPVIKSISFAYNIIGDADVDQIIIDLDFMVNGATRDIGELSVNAQTPITSIGITAAAAKYDLETTFAWTVYND